MDGVQVLTAPTAVTTVLRMRVDVDPWTDQRVVQALKMGQDREKIGQLAYYGQVDAGLDAHVARCTPLTVQKTYQRTIRREPKLCSPRPVIRMV